MNGCPPPILVETWINLINNRSPDLAHVKLPLRRAIKEFFGSMELAQLYVEQYKENDIEVHFVQLQHKVAVYNKRYEE